MTVKKFVKAFIAGMALPAVFLPLAYTVLFWSEPQPLKAHPVQFLALYLPLVWGLANVVYVKLSEDSSAKNVNSGMWVTGACLGFIVAVLGVFMLHIPTMIFGEMHGFQFAPLIILPIVYGALFRYVVKWLNKVIAV